MGADQWRSAHDTWLRRRGGPWCYACAMADTPEWEPAVARAWWYPGIVPDESPLLVPVCAGYGGPIVSHLRDPRAGEV